MDKFSLRKIKTDNMEAELDSIGFDSSYVKLASEKYKFVNLKIYNLNSAQANILKQTALSLGTDCATNKNVIIHNIENSNVILGGSISQLKKISQKLKSQPFSLAALASKIEEALTEKERGRTKIVGILNVTPDSFSDGGLYLNPENACKHLVEMIRDGADMIDIGAESTRPYSVSVSDSEQIERLRPVLNFIQKEGVKIPISVDTRSAEVADFALNNGVDYINDVSGFDYDLKMSEVISKYNAGVILQHSKGTPENMQDNPSYNDVIEEVYTSLYEKIQKAFSCGIKNVVVDPGIGFGKSKKDNVQILERIEEIFSLDVPLMVGISRKSFLGEADINTKDALTLAVSYSLIKKKVDFLRVHNVNLHRQLINQVE